MRPMIAALALIATLSSVPALAQTPPAAPARPAPPITQPPTATIMAEPVALMIGACDMDGDARVTRPELRACVARSFASVDPAKSGAIGYIVFSDWAERWLGDRNALPSPFETDTDGDNRITPAELQAQFDKTFTRLDRDRDDVLVRAELLTLDGNRGGGFRRDDDRRDGDRRGSDRREPPDRQ